MWEITGSNAVFSECSSNNIDQYNDSYQFNSSWQKDEEREWYYWKFYYYKWRKKEEFHYFFQLIIFVWIEEMINDNWFCE